MGIVKLTFKASGYMKRKDPCNARLEHHDFWGRVDKLPLHVPTKPNPRAQNINKKLYRDVISSSLIKDPELLHLKTHGAKIFAQKVEIRGDEVSVWVNSEQGLADGAHSYQTLIQLQRFAQSKDSWFPINVRVNVPKKAVAQVVQGLNSSISVKEVSIANHSGQFNWIKESLKGRSFLSKVAFRENEKGCVIDVKKIIGVLSIYNPKLYAQPSPISKVGSYANKNVCMQKYLQSEANGSRHFHKFKKILPELLMIQDLFHKEMDEYQRKNSRLQLPFFLKTKNAGKYDLVFTGEKSSTVIHEGALFPMMGSLAKLIKEEKGQFVWKSGFKKVKELIKKDIAKFYKAALDQEATCGGKVYVMGRTSACWDAFNRIVK